MASAVFKTVVGREERPGCVRFAHASAIGSVLGDFVKAVSATRVRENTAGASYPRLHLPYTIRWTAAQEGWAVCGPLLPATQGD